MKTVIGVTGGIGSGKTAATDAFKRCGIDIIDADIIAHEIVAKGTPALAAIEKHFLHKHKHSILLADGELNRAKLRQIIFSDPAEKKWLEQFLHPLIRETIKEHIAQSTSAYCVLVAPLLLEGTLHEITDKILVVDCSEETQIERASQRDGQTPDAIKNIITQQISRKKRLARADIIVDNDGALDELNRQIQSVHQQLLLDAKP